MNHPRSPKGRLALLSLTVLGVMGCEQVEPQSPADSNPSPAAEPVIDADAGIQWKLPKSLREISGLALDEHQRLFAHDDEHGVIHEVDYVNGGIKKSFALGSTPVLDDFEGIALAGEFMVLSTSTGNLYITREGADGERVDYQKVETGLSSHCEFEGLDFDQKNRVFMLPCKQVRNDDSVGLKVYAWSLDHNQRQPDRDLFVSKDQLESATGKKRFPASGITLRPDTQKWMLTSAQRDYLLEMDYAGQHLTAIPLPSKFKHVQTEGIAVSSDGQLLLCDEGQQGRARLTIYPLF